MSLPQSPPSHLAIMSWRLGLCWVSLCNFKSSALEVAALDLVQIILEASFWLLHSLPLGMPALTIRCTGRVSRDAPFSASVSTLFLLLALLWECFGLTLNSCNRRRSICGGCRGGSNHAGEWRCKSQRSAAEGRRSIGDWSHHHHSIPGHRGHVVWPLRCFAGGVCGVCADRAGCRLVAHLHKVWSSLASVCMKM